MAKEGTRGTMLCILWGHPSHCGVVVPFFAGLQCMYPVCLVTEKSPAATDHSFSGKDHEATMSNDSTPPPLSSPPPPPPSPCSLDPPEWLSLPQGAAPASSSLEVEGASTSHTSYASQSQQQQQQQPHNSSLPRWMLREINEKSDSAIIYRLSNEDGNSSIGDFDSSEWTPPDSSYGAAIPIAGWIPKRIRRDIEWTVSVILITLCAALIITTSMRSERNKHNDAVYDTTSANNGGLDLDDDRYMYYDDAFYEQQQDDDAYRDEGEEFEQEDDDNDDNMDQEDNHHDEDEDEENGGQRMLRFDFFG